VSKDQDCLSSIARFILQYHKEQTHIDKAETCFPLEIHAIFFVLCSLYFYMQQPTIITIDGPAGSGKSTLGELLARRLGYLYFDTGVMYRALTWAVLHRQIDVHNQELLEQLAHQVVIEVVAPTQDDGRQYTVLLDGSDITWEIRQAEVDRNVSLVARYPGVRAEMRRRQRVIGQRGQVVMVGRDIGTIVMPEAPLKIYLDASLETRSRRRMAEQYRRDDTVSLEETRAAVARRDELDQHVLQPAPDALILHSDTHSPEEEVAQIIALFDPAEPPSSA